jgi:hypothetical protein
MARVHFPPKIDLKVKDIAMHGQNDFGGFFRALASAGVQAIRRLTIGCPMVWINDPLMPELDPPEGPCSVICSFLKCLLSADLARGLLELEINLPGSYCSQVTGVHGSAEDFDIEESFHELKETMVKILNAAPELKHIRVGDIDTTVEEEDPIREAHGFDTDTTPFSDTVVGSLLILLYTHLHSRNGILSVRRIKSTGPLCFYMKEGKWMIRYFSRPPPNGASFSDNTQLLNRTYHGDSVTYISGNDRVLWLLKGSFVQVPFELSLEDAEGEEFPFWRFTQADVWHRSFGQVMADSTTPGLSVASCDGVASGVSSSALTKADLFNDWHTLSHLLGVFGEGIKIGVIDNGVRAECFARPDAAHDCPFATSSGGFLGGWTTTVPWFVEAPLPDRNVCHGTAICDIILRLAPKSTVLMCPVGQAMDHAGNMASSINWLIEQGVHVINISYGFAVCIPVIEQAIRDARHRGVLVVCAAANDSRVKGDVTFPASISDVFCIGSHDSRGFIARHSSIGPNVLALAPGESVIIGRPCGESVEYLFGEGTSFAAPYVVGMLALALSFADTHGVAFESNYSKCDAFKYFIRKCCENFGSHRTGEGYGLIRIREAFGPTSETASASMRSLLLLSLARARGQM